MIHWHNTTKDIINESDLDDFLLTFEVGDKVYFSEDGRSLIFPLLDISSDEDDLEYDWVRSEFQSAWYERQEINQIL